jgi:hypothetical protein
MARPFRIGVTGGPSCSCNPDQSPSFETGRAVPVTVLSNLLRASAEAVDPQDSVIVLGESLWGSRFTLLQMPDDTRWHTRHKSRRRGVVSQDCPGCDDGIGKTVAAVPIHTFLSIVIGSTVT